jgi:hypothetical protein
VTVAKEANEDYRRFIRSLDQYKLAHETYGLDQWDGTSSKKLIILREQLEKYKSDSATLVLVTRLYL